MSTPRIHHWLPPIFLAIGLFFFHFQEVLSGGVFYGPYNDNIYWNLPQMSIVSRMIGSGELPLYNPVGFFPLYQNPIFSFLYPLNFLWLDLYATMEDALRTVYFLVLFHYGLILIATYFLLRTLRLSISASLFGACIYCFSVALSVVASWPNTLFSQVWAIFATAAFIRFLYHENWPVWGGLFAVFGSLMVLASASGSIIFFLYIWIAIFLSALTDKNSHARNPGWYKHAFIAGIICLLVSAPAILPYMLHASENVRWISLLDGKSMPFYGGGKIPFEATLTQQATPSELINVFWPTIGNDNSKGFYIGAIAFFFMALAVLDVTNWKDKLFKSNVILMVWSLLSIAGSNLGMAYLNYRLPGLGDLREPWFFSYIFSLFAAIVAAYGLQTVISARLRGVFVVLVAACIVVLLTVLKQSGAKHYLSQIYWVDVGVITLIAGAAWLCIGKKLSGEQPLVIVVTLILSAAISYEVRLHPLSPPDPIATSPYYTSKGKAIAEIYTRLKGLENINLFRTISDIKPNSGAGEPRKVDTLSDFYPNVRGMREASSPHPKGIFQDYNYRFSIPGYYQLHGVKYTISDNSDYSRSGNYRELFKVDDFAVYESANAVPEFFLAYQLSGFYSTPQDYWRKISGHDDVANSVFVNEADKNLVAGIPVRKGGVTSEAIRIVKNVVNSKIVTAKLNEPGLLVLNEHFSPSWGVLVDGKQVKPICVNKNQIGVFLKEGEHTVEYSYMPGEFMVLLYGFAIGILAVIVQLLWCKRMFNHKVMN